MKKKNYGIIALIAALVLATASLAACGSQKPAETTAPETTTTETTTAQETTTAAETTTAQETTAAETTQAVTEAPADPSGGELPPPADDLEAACRETALDVAGHDKTIVSSEHMEGTIGGYTGGYYRIGVMDADGNITYYNGKADFMYTDEEVAELNAEYADDGELPPPADDLEAACRETALDVAGHDKTIVSSEHMEGTIGGYTGGYYRIGVMDENGNVTYYNGKADFMYTDEEVAELNAEYGN